MRKNKGFWQGFVSCVLLAALVMGLAVHAGAAQRKEGKEKKTARQTVVTVERVEEKAAETKGAAVTEEKAKEIALKKAGSGAEVVECGLDRDDGRLVYELELRSGNWE